MSSKVLINWVAKEMDLKTGTGGRWMYHAFGFAFGRIQNRILLPMLIRNYDILSLNSGFHRPREGLSRSLFLCIISGPGPSLCLWLVDWVLPYRSPSSNVSSIKTKVISPCGFGVPRVCPYLEGCYGLGQILLCTVSVKPHVWLHEEQLEQR